MQPYAIAKMHNSENVEPDDVQTGRDERMDREDGGGSMPKKEDLRACVTELGGANGY
jgi:hypothetical protein